MHCTVTLSLLYLEKHYRLLQHTSISIYQIHSALNQYTAELAYKDPAFLCHVYIFSLISEFRSLIMIRKFSMKNTWSQNRDLQLIVTSTMVNSVNLIVDSGITGSESMYLISISSIYER